MKRNNFVGLVSAACLWSSGCGNPAIPPIAKVSGVVTYQGKPLTTGSVQFIPDSSKGTTGRMAIGPIGADGQFELTTLNKSDGAQVGHHVVVIQAFEVVPPATTSEPPPAKALIPLKYTDPSASSLRAEVKSGISNKIDFDLTR